MAMILDAFVSQLSEILGSLVREEVVILFSVKDEIRKLHKKLQMMENLLDDAEKRRIKEKNIDLWLKDLRDIMYDADDVIDEYLFECKKQNQQLLEGLQQPPSTLATLVCCYPSLTSCCYSLPSRHKIGRKMKAINAKLEEISKVKDQFNLKFDNMDGKEFSQVSYETSHLPQNEIVGSQIKEDSRKIIDLLVQRNEAKGCLTLGIVGMGGIGKTTLAQEIFNDEIINRSFPIRMWVYVSKNFDELNILKAIIRLAGGSSHHEQVTKTELHLKLCEVIENKRILLVLDDVWDAKVWNSLQVLYNCCVVGSRVLVTTRDKGVMRQMGAMHLHHVGRLSPEDGWAILYRKVLLNGVDVTKVEGLKEIGVKIVEKCNGHPLAIQAMGGVLLSMPDATEKTKWKEVLEKLENQTWSLTKFQENGFIKEDEVLSVLYLSYQALPSCLKPCFLYFSSFAEGFAYGKMSICGSWISEGLIRAEKDLSLEKVAEGYYKELIRRNLLQLDPTAYDDFRCNMHDLLLSLAKSMVEENYVGDFHNLGDVTSVNTNIRPRRRLSMIDEAALAIPEAIKQHKRLRALRLVHAPSIQDVPEDLFTKLRRLRVLDLSGTNINELPKSIGNLIHLRRLDISSTCISEIPEVIGRLINLQFFDLQNCKNLHGLPRRITNLCNLRLLDFSDSPVDQLPEGIGGLQNLRYLFEFVVSSPHEQRSGGGHRRGGRGSSSFVGSNLGELKNLREITRLSVTKLERAASDAEAREAALSEKQHLVRLNLKWTRRLLTDGVDKEEETEKIGGVIEALRPPPSLQLLEFVGFFDLRPPSWLDSSCGTLLPNLRRLDLTDCVGLRQLPPLGRLPQLDFLAVEGASAIVTIGPELMSGGEDGVPFPKLTGLFISDMPNWEEWQRMEDGSFPRLEVLTIHTCPKLRSLPDTGLVRVKDAVIGDCPCLEKLSCLPAVESLKLYLDMEEDTLPKWLQHNQLGAVQKLKIWCGFDLLKKLLPKEMHGGDGDGPEWLKLQHFPHVYVKDRRVGSIYYFSYTKCPPSFNTNVPN